MTVLANSVDPDQVASSEAKWCALFVIKYVNFYQKPGSSNLAGWKSEVGVAIYSAWQGFKYFIFQRKHLSTEPLQIENDF